MKKLRTTTPASVSTKAKRAFLIFSAVVLAGVGVASMQVRPASADQYDDKIRALQADMSRYQAEASRLNAEADTLSNALAQITNDKNALQAQVDVSQAKYDKLVIQIADTEKEIVDIQNALGKTIANLSINDEVSPIERVAGSQNIGDFIDGQEQLNSISTDLDAKVKKLHDLKAQLATQKEEVTKVLAQQKSDRDALAAKESEQSSLLAKTQNDESKYQGLIKDSQAQIAAARAAQAAMNARSNSTGGYTIVDSNQLNGYPWNSSNCPMMGYMSTGGSNGNGEDGYGYGCRQCVSYVAYRIAKETGYYYRDLGNGGSAAYNASKKSGFGSPVSRPTPGTSGWVASLWGTSYPPYSSGSSPGHTAWVEAVSADGSQVLVSQYNYNYGSGWGMYSQMWLSSGFFDQYTKAP